MTTTHARFSPSSIAWPLAAIGLVLAMQLTMVFTRPVNWDEFWFHYHVHEFVRGAQQNPLQSLHGRLFAWLTAIPGNTVEAIAMARLVMLGCEMLTLGAIYALARRFTTSGIAALAALLYISAGFVFQHGFSFRTDPMITAALMWALVVLARTRLRLPEILAFGLLAGFATMISVKTVLLAPAFAGIAWLRFAKSNRDPRMALRIVACSVAALAAFLTIYSWHASGLGTGSQEANSNAGGTLAGSLAWMFFLGIPPYWHMFAKGAMIAVVLTALACWTPRLLWKEDRDRAEKIALAGLWFPMLCPLFYTNTAPYFYAYSMAPVAVSVVWAAEKLVARYDLRKIAMLLLVLTAALLITEDRQTVSRQKQVVEAADAMFAEDIAYFDHDGMIARFDKANDFLTPWGMAQYAQRGTSIYRETMEQRTVPLLLANADVLQEAMDGEPVPLTETDIAALRGNYIRYWGPFYVAGKRVDGAGQEEFLVPGPYRVAEGSVAVDGTTYDAGDAMEIARGTRNLSGEGTLIWNGVGDKPAEAWDDGPLYVDF
ncbi:ArnT family glycosyltransferase [Alteraurantiacibacter aquimixticola]|uniref:Glycosyltransferase RgtA/B/C/D-like domain-containing protein n=1 Tax=Alteraurantiacibacter aquimixticola TaxID=2489173 RepID=A0A4V4U9N4_9SPHN|nr:glycosyltransferase family 39 protein [Alteraurantiacibacter aquimixticola]TIX51837.1 hypothetical protein E5222_05180 [Alteraurantiacibacter aquimixticola]